MSSAGRRSLKCGGRGHRLAGPVSTRRNVAVTLQPHRSVEPNRPPSRLHQRAPLTSRPGGHRLSDKVIPRGSPTISGSVLRVATAAVVVMIAPMAVGCGRVAPRAPAAGMPTIRASPPSTFVAQWSSPATDKDPVLEVPSTATDAPVRQLLKLPGWPVTVTGPFRGSDGALWYTTSTGPQERSGVAGGDPAPRSCASEIVRRDGATGKASTVLDGRSDQLIQGAVPSPDGARLVYSAEGCTGYFDWHLIGAAHGHPRPHRRGRAEVRHLVLDPFHVMAGGWRLGSTAMEPPAKAWPPHLTKGRPFRPLLIAP